MIKLLSIEDTIASYTANLNELLNRLNNQFHSVNDPDWRSINNILRELDDKPKPVDKVTRMAQIEVELNIIKGITPTPRGYKIDKTNIKILIKELKQLTCSS